MITSGVKTEEYREIKPHWTRRLMNETAGFKHYDAVLFQNGYSEKSPRAMYRFIETKFGTADPEWSDNWQGAVFVIKLGERMEIPKVEMPKTIYAWADI